MSGSIDILLMPKWGMTMTEGTLIEWLVEEGAEIAIGDEIAEVETEKMTGPVEAQVAGVLRRRVASDGDVVPVGGTLGVVADAAVSDEEIQAFVDAAAAVAPRDVADEQDGARSETFATSLGDVHAVVRGDGPNVVVLLHGFGGDALNWRFNIEELAEERTVIAVDLPGHGGSTKNVGDGTVDELAAAVAEVLDSRDVTHAHLVGHSLGGLVAGALAMRRPDLVASLALVAPAGLGPEINGDFIDGFVAASSRRELKSVLRTLYADENLVNRQLVEEVLKYKRLEGVQEALGAIRDQAFPGGRQERGIAADLEALSVPVLVVWGSADQVIPSSHSGAAPQGARLEQLDGVGHSPHIEAAVEVNRLLGDFAAAHAGQR